jgi:hypothetical protein
MEDKEMKLPNVDEVVGDTTSFGRKFRGRDGTGTYSYTETGLELGAHWEARKTEALKNEGTRLNKGKLRWQNVPLWMFEEVIRAGQFGERKYGTYNFLKGLKVNECLDSMKRHASEFENPNKPDIDSESGVHHLGCVAWNAIVALYMVQNRPDLDDRYKGDLK